MPPDHLKHRGEDHAYTKYVYWHRHFSQSEMCKPANQSSTATFKYMWLSPAVQTAGGNRNGPPLLYISF